MSTSTTAEPSSPLVIVSKEQIVGRAWARYYPFWERCLLWRVLVRSPGGLSKSAAIVALATGSRFQSRELSHVPEPSGIRSRQPWNA